MQETAPTRKSLKRRTHEILEVASEGDWASRIADILILTLVATNIIAVVVETVEPIRLAYADFFLLFERFSVAVFTLEYLLRIWSVTTSPTFERPIAGRLRFALTPMALVDLFAILPFYLSLLGPIDLRVLRILRMFRVLRILKLTRYSETMLIFASVLRSKKEQLILALSAAFILLMLSSSVLYFAEREAQPDAFSSIPAAMWWAIATLTTVGYVDIYPITALGRLFGAVVAILGVGLFALPAGILASGFSERLKNPDDARCPHCGKQLQVPTRGA